MILTTLTTGVAFINLGPLNTVAAMAIAFTKMLLVLFFFMGIYAGRRSRLAGGIVSIAIAAAVETTLGWYVAALIGPGYVPGWTMRILVVMAVQSAILSTAIGAVGVWIGERSPRATTAKQTRR